MGYGLTLVVPPAGEPLSLAEAKLHLRQDQCEDDSLITGLIIAARERAELVSAKQIVTATWCMTIDRFPWTPSWPGRYRYPGYSVRGDAGSRGDRGDVIRLPKSPVRQVTSLQYVDTFGNTQTLDPTLYQVDYTRDPARIAPAYGQIYPITRDQMDAISITYVSGLGPATSIVAAIAAGTQTVTPASMAGIYAGTVMTVDVGVNCETVSVASVTGTTFTATFRKPHSAGSVVSGIPEQMKTAMKLLVGHWYANREAVVVGTSAAELPIGAEALLTGNWTGQIV